MLLTTLTLLCNAQTLDMKRDLDTVYSGLDRNIFNATGIFVGRYPTFSNLDIFTGKNDTAKSAYSTWRQHYFELSNGYFDTVDINADTISYVPIDVILENARDKLLNDSIPIGILNFQYHNYRIQAFDSSYIEYDSINNTIIYNDTNRINLYETRTAFDFAPLVTSLYLEYPNLVVFDSNFYFSNYGQNSSTVFRINFGNGGGFETITFGDAVALTYNDTTLTEVTWTMEVIQNGDTLKSKTVIPFQRKASYGSGEHAFDFTSTIGWGTELRCTNWVVVTKVTIDPITGRPRQYQVKKCTQYSNVPILGKGLVTVKRGIDPATGQPRTPTSCYKKPIIILDGIDFGSADIGPRGCKDGRCGDFGWFDLSQPQLREKYPQLALMPDLIDDLVQNNHDVIFLDNEYGADFIQRNAMLLVGLINKINDEKCDCDELVVIGPSMGGQVARYALSYMEQNNIPHQVRLFIAFDSPNKGANIPLGAQKVIEYVTNVQEGANKAYKDKLLSPACKQLLVAHCNMGGFNSDPLRGSFLSDLSSIGNYPSKLRKLTVINGSKNAQEIFAPSNAQLVKYNFLLGFVNGRLNAWGTPGVGVAGRDNVIAQLNSNKSPKRYIQVDGSTPRYDNAPGCRGDYINMIETEFVDAPGDGPGVLKVLQSWQSFISSISALGTVQNSLSYNIGASITDNTVPNSVLYSYDGYFAPTVNERHVEITQDNMNYVLNQIKDNDTYFPSIPNSNGSTFNFGSIEHKKLPSTTINNSGIVHVNGNFATKYGSGVTPDAGGTFEILASACEPLIVENGGQFVAGDNNGSSNNKAIVRFGYGSVLDIRNGGTLKVYNNSKVVIEEGATLIYHPGAQIILDGADAILEIRGRLEIKAGATFTFTSSSGVTNGFVRFDLSHYTSEGIAVTGTTASVSLAGANIQGLFQDKVLEVIGGELTTPDNSLGATEYLSSFTVYNGMVNLKDGAKIIPTVINSFTYTYFNGEGVGSTEEGLVITKPALTTIHHCSFNGLNKGINFYMNSHPSAFPISYSSFYNNNIGISSTDGGGLNIINSTFANNTTGITATSLAQDSKFEDCSFSNNSSVAVSLSATTTVNSYFNHSSFTSNALGIDATDALNNVNVTLKCNKFKNNNYGVEAGKNLNLSPTKTFGGYSGGDNVFYYNNSAPSNCIALYHAYSIYLQSGGNSFINVGSSTNDMFIFGEVITCTPTPCDFYNTTTTLKGSGNYWNPAPTSNNLNNGSGTLYSITSGGATRLLDGPILSSFTSSCFYIPSGTEPQFVSSSTAPFSKTGDIEEVEETETKNKSVDFRIFPNPAKDKLYVQLPVNNNIQYTVELFDLLGRKVFENSFTGNNQSIIEVPTSSLAAGQYIFTIKATDGSLIENRRVVIKND